MIYDDGLNRMGCVVASVDNMNWLYECKGSIVSSSGLIAGLFDVGSAGDVASSSNATSASHVSSSDSASSSHVSCSSSDVLSSGCNISSSISISSVISCGNSSSGSGGNISGVSA